MTDIVCVSPVDGRELVRRAPASDAYLAQCVGQARAAQREWARTPIPERARYARAAVEAMLAMEGEVSPERASAPSCKRARCL
jgi:acyl-CoA reductase-like NAD-dependent aldehyde dehydrogenase